MSNQKDSIMSILSPDDSDVPVHEIESAIGYRYNEPKEQSDELADSGEPVLQEKKNTADNPIYYGVWNYQFCSKITTAGKMLVLRDPNLLPGTIKQLMNTEFPKFLTQKEMNRCTKTSDSDLAYEEFYSNNETGIAHLSLCLDETRGKCMAELIDVFADDRNIPFVVAALYILALKRHEGLHSIAFKANYGYYHVPWAPIEVNVVPITSLPPHMQEKYRALKKELEEHKDHKLPELQPCPVCGSIGKLLRCGPNNRRWHVCCSKADNNCFLSFGIPNLFLTSEEQAATIWNSIQVDEAC